MVDCNELVFYSFAEAKEKAKELKKFCGYNPKIFSIKKHGSKKVKYIVANPKMV